MLINLVKVHGSGNTFYLLETTRNVEEDLRELTKWLCEEVNNGGADGLLVVLPSAIATAKMRVFNADGSEASMCGNGLRCVARYVCEKESLESATIETMKAVLNVEKVESIFKEIPTYKVEISPVSFELNSLPMQYENLNEINNQVLSMFSSSIKYSALSVPNPHLIGLVDESYISDTTHQKELATQLNNENPYCPDGVNVSYVLPISENEIFVRTFERGVGFTNACGTAMTASALIAQKNNYINSNKVTVYNPGGFVRCEVRINGKQISLSLEGNATVISKHQINIADGEFLWINEVVTDEQDEYMQCLSFTSEKINGKIKQTN